MPVNSGLSVLRKYGVELATGEYVIHCDSDDWVDDRMYEDLYETAITTDSDMVVCDFYQTDSNRKVHIKSCYNSNREDFLFDCLCGKSSWVVWNKMVRRDLYERLEIYPSSNMGEDMVISMQLICKAKKIFNIDKAFYYYYSNDSSIVRSATNEQVLKRFNQAVDNALLVERVLKKYLSGFKFSLAFDVLHFRQRNLLQPLLYDRRYYKIWMSTFPKLLFSVWMNPYISLRDKAKFYLSVIRLYK
jgi:glycosyltransferase involved in cell wall biosynthesis